MRGVILRLPLALVLAAGLSLGFTGDVRAETSGTEICASLSIPDPLTLACEPLPPADQPTAVIAPHEGKFAPLSRMTIRRLSREQNALAWEDPEAWLREQMTFDTSAFAGAIQGFATGPDSPFASETAQAAVETLAAGIEQLGRLALQACEDPQKTGEGRWGMVCEFAAGGLGMLLHLRLVADRGERWSISMRTMNEQRLRHFEAIANSFEPPA